MSHEFEVLILFCVFVCAFFWVFRRMFVRVVCQFGLGRRCLGKISENFDVKEYGIKMGLFFFF